MNGELLEINGPLALARLPGAAIGEQVLIGELGLLAEVIGLRDDRASLQVYESTAGLRPGEAVTALGTPLSVELGPGLLGGLFDGVQRPLAALRGESGDHIGRGCRPPALDRQRLWPFVPAPGLAPGAAVHPGMVLGEVRENPSFSHRILVPPGVAGTLADLVAAGDYAVEATVALVSEPGGQFRKLSLLQRWPVRVARPYQRRQPASEPLLTGQRVLDTFFPLLKGGKAAIPGPFGAGKTMLLQAITRWCNAGIVIFVGCGERGNELVDVLDNIPRLTDPVSGRPLAERTLLVANTSNMPVVAREASIYVGITIAEYFRDQGCDVLLVADSTSRWAEALREVSGRLGEMPVEDGYPAYLASRLAAFYERAGRVDTLAGGAGSVTLIGAVSPPGGDFSEPVTSHTKEIVEVFWGLAKELADARHYPAIGWLDSFSGEVAAAARWWHATVDPAWAARRAEALGLLAEAEELVRIVNLVGAEALSPAQRWALESAALIREGVLQQNATDAVDACCAPARQFLLLDLLLEIRRQGNDLLALGVPVQQLLALPLLAEARRYKTAYGDSALSGLAACREQIRNTFSQLSAEYGGNSGGNSGDGSGGAR